MGATHYNIRNPCRQLPKINHEFPKQSLRYKLNVVLNETETISLIMTGQLNNYV